jgi:hypothetical protein
MILPRRCIKNLQIKNDHLLLPLSITTIKKFKNQNRIYKPGVTASAFILVGIGVRYATVVNNYLNGDPNNSATGVDVWQSDFNIRIMNNHMTHTRVGVGVARTETGSYISGLNNVVIQYNYIDVTLYDNVLINGGDYIYVTQNCLKNAGQDGVHVTNRLGIYPHTLVSHIITYLEKKVTR